MNYFNNEKKDILSSSKSQKAIISVRAHFIKDFFLESLASFIRCRLKNKRRELVSTAKSERENQILFLNHLGVLVSIAKAKFYRLQLSRFSLEIEKSAYQFVWI